MLNQIAAQNPRLWGGTADVSSTTKAFVTDKKGEMTIFSHKKPKANNIAFGVREAGMGAICNGLALHGFTPYCSTFLAFSNYMMPQIRLSAYMNLPVTYIFTHDGVGNGPDGATHQGNENIATLRLVPNLNVYRPAGDTETAAVYEYAFAKQQPACIILSRGSVASPLEKVEVDEKKTLHGYMLASGSDVQICKKAKKMLGGCGIFVDVISVPCLERLDAKRFNRRIPVFAVEMGVGTPWWAFIGKNGLRGDVISFEGFGASGKDSDVLKQLGFTPDLVADRVMRYFE
jgi:transketolase